MHRFLPLILSFSFFLACTKKETINQIDHINVIIDDNTAPPYNQVTTIQIQNYINKTYIDLLGREPLQQELEDHTHLLKSNNLSLQSRTLLLDQLMENPLYYDRFFETYSVAYLNGVAEQIILQYINELENLKTQAEQMGDLTLAQFYQIEIDKLEDLQAASADYENKAISISEFMQRICYNLLYDEINMGSENFVLSCFENFLKRFPTEQERAAGVNMVNGFSSQLLLQDGSTKKDFIEIITSTPGFYEGLAIDIYRQLLARSPNSEEMNDATTQLTEDPDYQAIQKNVMVSAEYAGF